MFFWSKGIDGEKRRKERERAISLMPLEGEECECFWKESEEIRAEPELGGLGPGLTGEHTMYTFVVGRQVGENHKRWEIKKRFRQLVIFDKLLSQVLAEQGKPEDTLMEFPEKKIFGKMSPSLVKERQDKLHEYLKNIASDKELVCEPIVREFLGLPMTQEEADLLEEAAAKSGDGLLTGFGGHESYYMRTRREKQLGIHKSQKREMVAGPPTLGGAAEVGAAFAESAQDDPKASKKWVITIPLLGQTVKEVFGGEVNGLHSTYAETIKEQVKKSSKQTRKDDPLAT